MIQANELRIGNWVSYYFDGVAFRICEINAFWGNNVKVNGFNKEQINPIPLTPEILEKAGFEKKVVKKYGYDEIFLKGNIFFDFAYAWLGTYSPLERGKSKYDLFWSIGIQNVHQLQNVFYYLTGQELEINL